MSEEVKTNITNRKKPCIVNAAANVSGMRMFTAMATSHSVTTITITTTLAAEEQMRLGLLI